MAPCGRVGGAPYGDKAMMDKNFRWAKKTLEVQFLGGSPQLRQRVMADAAIWTNYSGVTFLETTGKGDIRVAFDPQGGHWSHLGNYAQRLNRKHASMNLQVNDTTDAGELRAVVLHEFGHALGFLHEHRRGDSGLVWNEEEVYRYYTGYPNFWSRRMVDEQVLAPVANPRNAIFSQYDSRSIMHYPITRDFLKNGKPTGWNKNLSYNDKVAVRYAYPK
jgi:serralysin